MQRMSSRSLATQCSRRRAAWCWAGLGPRSGMAEVACPAPALALLSQKPLTCRSMMCGEHGEVCNPATCQLKHVVCIPAQHASCWTYFYAFGRASSQLAQRCSCL